MATITGIVRAAYPAAADRRAAILPRSAGDVQLGAAAAGSAGSGSTSSASTGTSAGSGASSGDPSGAGPAASATAPDVDLDSLVGSVDRRVRVGGLVVDLGPDRFRIDDGTAIGTVMLTGSALDLLTLIEPGDAIQATGTVVRTDQGLVVTIADPAALTKAGDPVPQDASSPAAGTVASPVTATGTHDLAGFGLPGGSPAGLAGVAVLVALSIVSLIVTLAVRRQRADRAFTGRIAARLAAIGAPGIGAVDGPSSAPDPTAPAPVSAPDVDPRVPYSA